MDNNNNKHLADLQASLEGWTDERFLTRKEIAIAYKINCYMVNLGDDAGIEFRGFSFRARLPLGLLVVKATIEKQSFVCFVSGRTFLTCFKIFFSRLLEDTVEWREDRYG